MATKTVTRTYYSKKKGTYVTKTYTYKHKSTKGKILVTKNGKVNQKNVNALKNAIQNDPNFNDAEKRAALMDLNVRVSYMSKNKKRLTTTGFQGWLKDNKYDRFFANAGYSLEEFAEDDEINLSPDYIRNESNWDKGMLKLKNGHAVVFHFTYTGNFWEIV